MSQTQTSLQVFVASPSDVAEERKILESVVREINRTANDAHNIILKLLDWETDSRPGFRKEGPQDVINQQIGNDYDIFLGIMWGRFGSPTPRAESGTEEEFDLAFSRWEKSPESLEIMFYFKDAGIPPSELDPKQLAQVHAFKKKISALGGLYHEFQDAEDFRTEVSAHLRGVIQDWPKPALSDPETALSAYEDDYDAELARRVAEAHQGGTGCSPAATAIARLFVERSKHGLGGDPQFRVGELAQETDLSIEDTHDAIDELSDFVEMSDSMVEISRQYVSAKGTCFAEFDRHWKPWNPAEDALQLAADLVNDPEFPSAPGEVAERYDWKPRRLNPAISYLFEQGLIHDLRITNTSPYAVAGIVGNDQTRRFVKDQMW